MLLVLNAINFPFVGAIGLSGFILVVFFICFFAVLAFEFVNGFHDTANAVATVIYTKTLKPYPAIVWSGLWNFLGVFVIGTAVAMSLLKLVPLEKLITLPVQVGACLVIAILLSSIIWNLGTWYLGIPLSSSHTLIGAMVGASIGFTYYYGGSGVNWGKAKEIALSLFISPVIGFAGSALLMYLEKNFIRSKRWFHAPKSDEDKPPFAIRALLVATCTLVSFFHGSNDGQKGVGLMMLVLIAFLPASFALNKTVSNEKILVLLNNTEETLHKIPLETSKQKAVVFKLKTQIEQAKFQLSKLNSDNIKQKFGFRKQLQTITSAIKTVAADKETRLPDQLKKLLEADEKGLEKATDFAPLWVLAAISLSLGLGTMIGWKRIVVTIGEKIGNENLNYAQGATAEIVTAATIGLSTGLGLPVSTTHVLSSGVAGAMAASKGTKSLNFKTLRSIGIAWLLTLPAAIVLSLLLFMFFHLFV
ncbi:inorganic phosphate transporter [uncultured Mucilaginibacter sp.]|uniref:inorganic phosphate transporter n=1 Tax=uncultured Mucilaginibacter sp. TaxID=797541 RepID=UPI002624A4BE|nr:inorganic phosphate transporter [uncultured Mucilaginibacter sp.]